MFQLPLFTTSTPWLSVRGAALIAGVEAGVYPSYADAARSIPAPEPAADARPGDQAEQHYQRFVRLRDARRLHHT